MISRTHTGVEAVRGAWARLARDEDVDYQEGYVRFREAAEPGQGTLVGCHDADGALAAGTFGAIATGATPMFSRPVALLTSSLMLRVDCQAAGPLDRDVDAALAAHGGGSSLEAARERMEGLLEPMLVVRSLRDSRVLVDPDLEPERRPEALRLVVRELKRFATESGCRAVAFPYVPAGDGALLAILQEEGFGDAGMCAGTTFDLSRTATRDEFIASLPKRTRRAFRREISEFETSEFELREVSLESSMDRVAALEHATAAKHGAAPGLDLVRAHVAALARSVRDHLRVVGCFRGDTLVASGMDVRGRRTYFCLSYGADYSVMPAGCAYQMLTFYHPIEYALGHGLQQVYLGIDVYEAKVRRGAALAPLRTCVWSSEARGTALLRDWLPMVERRNDHYFAALQRG